ncbi:MAG: D-alanyl-D-alanine carboxypeptidase [Paraglaciecola sp.]|jgi:D-alanyl-D-alanine carboxypeptidase
MKLLKSLQKGAITTAVTLTLAACGSSNGSTPTPTPAPTPAPTVVYQDVINDLVSIDIPGIVLLVETPEGRFLGSAGVSNLETQQAMQVGDTMPTASTGKKMIALLAIQLADEGLLNLDDTIDTWLGENILSRIANSQQMTLRQLLNHTSGVFNYADVEGDGYTDLLLAEPEVLKTDIDFLELVFDHPGYFLPGEGYEYSNSGYSLAALIMDEVLGEHHSVALRNRFFDPLGMTSTYYKGSEASLGDFISGYLTTDEGDQLDTRQFLINTSQAGSPLISSVEDMAIFLKALITDDSFANDVVKNTMFGEDNLITQDATEKSGLGIDVATIDGHTVYAHSGLTFGYTAQSAYIEETDTSIALFFNCGAGGINTCASTFDELVQTVLENELN